MISFEKSIVLFSCPFEITANSNPIIINICFMFRSIFYNARQRFEAWRSGGFRSTKLSIHHKS